MNIAFAPFRLTLIEGSSTNWNPNHAKRTNVTVSISDIKAFIAYAAMDVFIAVGMFAVAPKGLGQVLGVAFALMLLPVPALVLYFTRWRNVAHGKQA